MRIQTFIATVALTLAACTVKPATQVSVSDEPVDVSLINLIATPERYEGRQVRLIGYLHQEFESSGIYLTQDDHELSIYRNGLWLSGFCGSGSSLNDKYVLIEARFTGGEHGHMGMWSGSLSDVTRCVPWASKKPSGASNNSFKPNPHRGGA